MTPHPLATRLRQLADEIDSAHRFGVPIPASVTVGHSEHSDISFVEPDRATFDAWVDYTEATTRTEDIGYARYVIATADVNGLPLRFQTAAPIPTEVAS